MANSLIKGLALTLGGGLAVGLGIKIGQSTTPPPPPQEAVDFGPVLDRIEGVESRIVNVESAHAALAAMTEAGPMIIPTVQELEARVQAHGSEVEALRAAIQRATEKHDARIDDLGYAVSTLEARIPVMIDESVKPRFEELHDRVQREMQETASQTLEIFADRIQARVVEKITSIEGDLTRQSEAINDLRDYSLKTDQNLQRLLAGVENLADKINRKFEGPLEPPRPVPPQRSAPVPPAPPSTSGSTQMSALVSEPAVSPSQLPTSEPSAPVPKPAPEAKLALETPPAEGSRISPVDQPMILTPPAQPFPLAKVELGEADDIRPPREAFPSSSRIFSGPEFQDPRAGRPQTSPGLRKAVLAGGGLAVFAALFTGVELSGVLNKPTSAHSTTKVAGPATAGGDALDTRKLAEQSELLDQATVFVQKSDYAKAEEIYRTILKSDPSNVEVKRKLASVLFRDDKIEESTKILNSLNEEKVNQSSPDPR